jgi:hypothetical protein
MARSPVRAGLLSGAESGADPSASSRAGMFAHPTGELLIGNLLRGGGFLAGVKSRSSRQLEATKLKVTF